MYYAGTKDAAAAYSREVIQQTHYKAIIKSSSVDTHKNFRFFTCGFEILQLVTSFTVTLKALVRRRSQKCSVQFK